MKKYLLNMICFMALAMIAIPVTANDYLKIYFKDGHTERHYMHLVESISTTKYDLEGNLHDEYQMQQIIMPDTTYSYYLADIDSMSFKKVDEEQLKIKMESALTRIESFFSQSSTIEEMEIYIDEIKKIEGVEEVWREDDRCVVVKFWDWHTLCITYPIIPKRTQSRLKEIDNYLDNYSKTRRAPLTKDGKPIKVAIAFQMINDTRFDEEKEEMKLLKDKFDSMGFDVHFIPDEKTGEKFDVDFYDRRMLDYNIVILETHGSLIAGKHGLFTGESYKLWEGLTLAFEPFDMDDIRFDFCHTINKGDEKVSSVMFKEVNEDFIRKSKYKFAGGGPHIVFIGACETLKGNDILIREHNGKPEERRGSSAVAEIFFDKGADVVMGYNNYASYSSWAASSFFGSMLDGGSQETAYNRLPINYKDEDTEYEAALIDLINPYSEYENPKSIFFFNTHTVEKSDLEIYDECKSNGQIELKGVTYAYDINNPIPCGFRLAKEPNVDKLEPYQYEEKWADNLSHSGTEQDGRSEFSVNINPYYECTVYYRAYTYDGIHHNWGEERHFTIYKDLTLSTKVVSLKVGESSTVDITAGSGEYEVDDKNSPYAKATLQGTAITISAVSVGDATVVVTDKKTGQQITIEVAVTKDDTPTDVPAEAMDLGLPSGTKWASYNVGATKPEEYGGYYSWGETEVRDQYYFTTYSLCDGTVSSCHDIGENISGTEYDVAHVKWGGEWCMPTKDDFQELVYTCEYKETTRNGVKGYQFTGPNGKYIFLPYTGYYWNTENSNAGSEGCYWSATQTTSVSKAHEMSFKKDEVLWDCYINRFAGLSVRPVMHSTPSLADLTLSTTDPVTVVVDDKATIEITSGNGSYTAESDNEDVAIARVYDNASVIIKGCLLVLQQLP